MKDRVNRGLINFLLVIVIIILTLLFLEYTKLLDKIIGVFFALTPFYIGFFLSWLMTPVARMINRYFKIPIRFSNYLALLLSIVIVIVFFFVVIPLAIFQGASLVQSLPQILKDFNKNVVSSEIVNQDYVNWFMNTFNITQDSIINAIKNSFDVVASGVGYVLDKAFGFITIIAQIIFGYIIAFYFMGSISNFVKGILNLFNIDSNNKYRKLVLDMSKMLFSYIRGVVIISSLIFVLMTVGAAIIGIESPIVFGLISGVTNIIPYLGPVLGGIPIFIVALSMGWQQAILVVILIFIVQFIENNFFQPKIMSHVTNLHPVTIMIGLLVFANLFGFFGMIIATPVLSMIKVWLKQSRWKDKIDI